MGEVIVWLAVAGAAGLLGYGALLLGCGAVKHLGLADDVWRWLGGERGLRAGPDDGGPDVDDDAAE